MTQLYHQLYLANCAFINILFNANKTYDKRLLQNINKKSIHLNHLYERAFPSFFSLLSDDV